MTSTAAMLAALSKWIDASYPNDMDPELVMRRRTGKVTGELLEVHEAIEGWTGENPRKGVFAECDDVIRELLDVAVAALGAVEHLTGNRGYALDQLEGHILYVHTRAGLA